MALSEEMLLSYLIESEIDQPFEIVKFWDLYYKHNNINNVIKSFHEKKK